MTNTESTSTRGGESSPIYPPYNYILQTLSLVAAFYIMDLVLRGILGIYVGVTTGTIPAEMAVFQATYSPSILSAVAQLVLIILLLPLVAKVIYDAHQIERSPIGEFTTLERLYTVLFFSISVAIYLIGERIVFKSDPQIGLVLMVTGASLFLVVAGDLVSREFNLSFPQFSGGEKES